MKSESEIRERLERVEKSLVNSSGHDMSHLIGQRNILAWVLEDDDAAPGLGGEHWAGSGDRRF